MRIIIISSGISRLLEPILDAEKVVGIIQSTQRKKRSALKNFLHKFAFIYFRYFKKDEKDLAYFSKKRHIPYTKFIPKGDSTTKWIKMLKPDLMVVYSMSQLLKEDIFSIPKYGTINFHPSYLPMLRGPFPEFWYYYHTNLNPGGTVHFIDKGEDTGDIIRQEKIEITLGIKSKKYFDLMEGKLGVKLLLKSIDDIRSHKVKRIKQDKSIKLPRARNIKREEHQSLIDWNNWPIERIWHLLRGTEQWLDAIPKPKFLYQGQRWSIGKYIKKSNESISSYYEVIKIRGKYYLSLKDGLIELNVSFNLVSLIKNIILSGNK